MTRGKIHATDRGKMQDTLDKLNSLCRTLTRAISFELSGKLQSGYIVYVKDSSGKKARVACYPNKRIAHAFLHGVQKALSLMLPEELEGGLRIGKVREFFKHERIVCPECETDLTNVVNWVSCSEAHCKVRCPTCSSLVIRRMVSNILYRVFTVEAD